MKKHKLLIVAVLVLLILGAYFFLQPKTLKSLQSGLSNSVETATWKTYSNSRYSFEFKYPSNWKEIKDSKENLVFSITPSDTPFTKDNFPLPLLGVSVYSANKKGILSTFITNNSTSVAIGSEQGKEFKQVLGDITQILDEVEKGGQVYSFQFYSQSVDDEKTFRQMLATFVYTGK